MNVLMISRSIYEWDVRVRREARALAAAGHQVTFVGLPSDVASDGDIQLVGIGDQPRSRNADGQRRPFWYRIGRWTLLPEYRKRAERRFQGEALEAAMGIDARPDVIHAHDFPALEPAVDLARHYAARLVYDSHEFWAGRPRRGRPEPLRRRRSLKREAELARQADAVIMVSQQGAELLAGQLGLDHVAVIRNTFLMRPDLNHPPTPTGAVYAGRIAPRRDLETVFAVDMWREPGFSLHMIGEVDEVRIPDWAVTHPMASMEVVDELLANVGIGLVTMTSRYINHRIALPNKLFQSISVGVPVVAADVPQTASVVREHGLGELYTPGDARSLSRALQGVRDNYGSFSNNVIRARPLLDWSVDAGRLISIYDDLRS
ncbi:MAG TPA: glycosyltransferase [Acidimicrobiia bacterium]